MKFFWEYFRFYCHLSAEILTRILSLASFWILELFLSGFSLPTKTVNASAYKVQKAALLKNYSQVSALLVGLNRKFARVFFVADYF